MTTMQLSNHQHGILKHQKNPNGHLVIIAGPGCGKSETLGLNVKQMSEAERRNTVVIAYNKLTASSFNAKMGFATDIARTSSSLGHRTVSRAVKPRDIKTWVQVNKYDEIAADILEDGDFECEDKEKRNWVENAVRLCGLVRSNLAEQTDHTGIANIMDSHGIDAPFKAEEAGPIIEKMLRKGIRVAQRVVDFTDLVYLPHVMALEPEHFGRVLVDEAQDTSYAARSLLMKAGANGYTTWVGDPRQAIYRWAGAPPNGMQEIKDMLSADILPLPICYRCPTSHIDLVKEMAPELTAAPGAKTGRVIQMNQNYLYKGFSWKKGDLFLCRTNKPLVEVALKMLRMGIPVQMRNRGFDKDLLDMVEKIEKLCESKHEMFCESLNTYRRQMNELYAIKNASDHVVSSFNDKCNSVETLYENVWESGGRSVLEIKRQIKLMFQAGGDRVILSSIHSAKGEEAPRVFLVQPGKSTGKKKASAEDAAQEANLGFISRTRCTQEGEGHLFYLVNKKGELGDF